MTESPTTNAALREALMIAIDERWGWRGPDDRSVAEDYGDDADYFIRVMQPFLLAVTVVPDVDTAMLDRLTERYTSEPVPPCRVCGEPLSIASMGGGRLTEYACSSEDAKASVFSRTYDANSHYRRSHWLQPKHGDQDVLDLVAAIRAKGLDELDEDALQQAYLLHRDKWHVRIARQPEGMCIGECMPYIADEYRLYLAQPASDRLQP